MDVIQFLLLIAILILLIWDICLHLIFKRERKKEREYFELNARLNFIIAVGSLAILLISYLGWNIKDEILKRSEEPIRKMIDEKKVEYDSLLDNKNILKAGIYIVTDLEFKENRIFKFKDLSTIDNKHLPDLAHAPRLLITTSTGENLRIEKITNEYFILGKPISKSYSLFQEGDNPKYPKILKFDIWIADYNQK